MHVSRFNRFWLGAATLASCCLSAVASGEESMLDRILRAGERQVEVSLEEQLKQKADVIFKRGGVPIEVIKQANESAVANYRRVLIAGFDGNDGKRFTDELRGTMRDAKIFGKGFFRVSAPSGVDGRTSLDSLIAIAKRNKLNAVYYGEANSSMDRSLPFSKTECLERDKPIIGKCIKEQRKTCFNIVGEYRAVVNVVRVEDREILYTSSKNGSETEEICGLNDSPPSPTSELLEQAQKSVISGFRDDLVPRTDLVAVKLKKRGKGLAKSDVGQFKNAGNLVKDRLFNRGCGIWNDLYDRKDGDRYVNRESSDLAFNLGLCAEHEGDYDTAADHYETALKLVGRDRDLSQAILRVQEAQAVIAEL